MSETPIFITNPSLEEFSELLATMPCVACKQPGPNNYAGVWKPGADWRDRIEIQAIVLGRPPAPKDADRLLVWTTCEACWNRMGGMDGVLALVQKTFFSLIEPKDEAST